MSLRFVLMLSVIFITSCTTTKTHNFNNIIIDAIDNMNDLNGPYYLLPLAAKDNSVKNVKILLKHKANPNIKTQDGKCAMIYAIENRNLIMIELLLKYKANPNVNELQMTALHLARSFNFDNKSLQITELLLKNGAKINWQPLGKKTNTLLIDSVRKSPIDYIMFICNKGADVNIQGVGGNTALIEAVRGGRYDVVSQLLKRKVSVNVINSENLTALDYALFNIDDDVPSLDEKPIEANRIVKLLRKYEAKTAKELKAEKTTKP